MSSDLFCTTIARRLKRGCDGTECYRAARQGLSCYFKVVVGKFIQPVELNGFHMNDALLPCLSGI